MTISPAKRAAILARDGHRCLRCGTRMGLAIDHIRAKADGGTDRLENLQTLCEDCNGEKGDAYMDFRERRSPSGAEDR